MIDIMIFRTPCIVLALALLPVGCAPKISAERARTIELLSTASPQRLYSLEPLVPWNSSGPFFYNRILLGSTPITANSSRVVWHMARQAIIDGPDNGPVAMCFDPRIAIRFAGLGHHYDLLLCYQCGNGELFVDDKEVRGFTIRGSQSAFDAMLTDAHVPLSTSLADMRANWLRRTRLNEQTRSAYLRAMPPHLRAIWMADDDFSGREDSRTLAAALQEDEPRDDAQVRLLFELAGIPPDKPDWRDIDFFYERSPIALLLRYPTRTLIRVASSPDLSPAAMDGAARLLTGAIAEDVLEGKPVFAADLAPSLRARLTDPAQHAARRRAIEAAYPPPRSTAAS